MAVPNPTPIVRLIHVDNVVGCLRREALYAPNFEPDDGIAYRKIHNPEIQGSRRQRTIPCGPRGVVHDYVSFYFGYLSPMMLQLKTGQVAGYAEGQDPLVYLTSTAQRVRDSEGHFVFSNGHGVATFTDWFDDLKRLDEVDWDMVDERYWRDSIEDPDRQRRKQAEFLIHRSCGWELIETVVVGFPHMRDQVEAIMGGFDERLRRPVAVRRDWYYY